MVVTERNRHNFLLRKTPTLNTGKLKSGSFIAQSKTTS
jgi:hypothetical protein